MTAGRTLTYEELRSIPNLFVLMPGNDQFIHGKTKTLSGGVTRTAPLILLVIGIIVMPIFACMASAAQDGNQQVGFITLAIVVGLGFLWGIISLNRRYRHYNFIAGNGKLIPGQVTTARGESKVNVLDWLMFLFNLLTILSGTSWVERQTYEVTIEYVALAPDGRQIKGETKVRRNDLQNNLPMPGAPIALLYLADDKLIVL